MKKIILKEFRADPHELIKQVADISHGEIVLDETFIGIDESGVVQLVYMPLPECKETDMYKSLVKQIKYNTSTRVSGLATTSTVFGYFPPVEIRQKPFCSSTDFAEKNPKENRFLSYYCEKYIMPLFHEHYADNLNEHMDAISEVKDDWIMKGTIFTGGVINKSNQLNYHIDSQNIKGSINAMCYFTKDMQGGELVLPKYNARLVPKDKYVLLFRNDLVHGVAPLVELNNDSYRFSIVYYAQNRMQHCGTCAEELEKAREKGNR